MAFKLPIPWERIAAFALDQLLSRLGKNRDSTPLQRARVAFAVAKRHGDILDTPRTRTLEEELMVAIRAEMAPAPPVTPPASEQE